MKSFKTLQLSTPETASQLSYDPHSSSLLVSGPSLSIVSDHLRQNVSLAKSQPAELPKLLTKEPLEQPYLRFASPTDPSVSLSHSGLTLTCTGASIKHTKCRLTQSFNSGIHYFEVICPISCSGIAFGLEDSSGKNSVILKLFTTTPRVVGVLLDLEHYVFRLYTDEQLSSFAKEAVLSPGTWTPFLKIKNKGNMVVLNPFCSRCSVGIVDEGYLSPATNLSCKYANTLAIMNLPEKKVENDLEFLKENMGLEDPAVVQHCAISKDKDNKCMKVGIIQFKTKEAKEKAVKASEGKPIGEKMEHGDKLWETIANLWTKEKISAREAIGVTYKPKKPTTLPIPAPLPTGPAALPAPPTASQPASETAPKVEEKKEEMTEAKKEETAKYENKKAKLQLKSAFKACLTELNEKLAKDYKESVTNLLKADVQKAPELEPSKGGKVLALYLPSTDNLLLVEGSMMKLLERVHGKFAVPPTAFYNSPTSMESMIGLNLTKKEAAFLLQSMKWRALGEYLKKAHSDAVYDFLSALVSPVRHPNGYTGDDVIVQIKYMNAKATIDVAMKAISLERLYRSKVCEEYKEPKEMRIFALTSDEDLEYLMATFCKMEEMLWSMSQNPHADKALKQSWDQSPVKLQSAYSRLLSFQCYKNRLPNEVALAEAGLIQREDSTLVHFEDPSTQIENGISQLANKASTKDLWEELENQLPDSKLLSGKISPNVPLHCTLNNFPPVTSVSEVSAVQSCTQHPLVLVTYSDSSIGVYNSKVRLTRLVSTNMKVPSEEIWKAYGSAKLTVDEALEPVMPDVPGGEDSYYLDLLFIPTEDLTGESVSASAIAASKKPTEGPFDIAEVYSPMVLFSEESVKTTSPLALAAIIKNKIDNKYYVRIRKYGYFTEFLEYALRQTEGVYSTPFDSATFHIKDKPAALAHIWDYILNKAYTLDKFEKEKVLGMVSEQNYPLEGIVPLAAYATPFLDNIYEFRVFAKGENGEIMANLYKWIVPNKSFKIDTMKTTSVVCKEVQIQYNDEFVIIVHENGVNAFNKRDLEPVTHYEGKLEGKLGTVHLQGRTILIQEGEKVSLYKLEKEKKEVKEASAEPLGKLERDIKPEELTSIDLAAYGNAEGTIAINAEGKENPHSVLRKTVPTENGAETKNTWTIVGKSKEKEYEFEVEMDEEKDVENLDVELKFSKDALTVEERESINKAIAAEEKKSESERKRQADSDEPHIPLVVVWHKGATHNHTMSLSRLFMYDGKEFKSNYPQPEFIFAHQHHKHFLIKKCVIKSPLTAGEKCYPIGSGIIYTANHLSAFKNTTHSFTKESEYTAWLEERKQCKLELQPFEPAGFFQMGDGGELTFSLNVERPCKFIYLKPTAFRSKPTEMKHFASYPLTIEYFGVTGTVYESGMPSAPAWNKYLDISEAKLDTSCSLEISAFSTKEGIWQKLTTVSGIQLQDLELKEKTVKLLDREAAGQPQSGMWHLVYEDKELHKTVTRKYRLKIIPGENWKFAAASVQIYASKKVERQGELFKKVASTYLWKCMNEPELFNRVNKALCDLVCMADRDYNDRIKTMSLLRKIIESSPEQAELVRKNVNIEKFIKANVYQEQTEGFALKFLQLFQQFPDFGTKLHNFAIKELSEIQKTALRPSGIAGFKSILALVIPKVPETFLQQLIGKIYEISTKYLEAILTEEHIFLRTRLDVHSYPLSPVAWVAPALGKGEEKTVQVFGEGKKTPANNRCGYIYTQNTGRFILDCGKLHDLSTAVLYFKKDNTNSKARFDVAIYGYTEGKKAGKCLIYEKEYPTHVWERLTSIAYSSDKTKFDEKDELDSLVIPLGSFIGRYIIIDIALRKTYDNLTTKTWSMYDYLKDNVIAEVYGTPQGKDGTVVPELEAILRVEEHQKSVKRVGHSATYERIQSTKTHVELFRHKTEAKAAKSDIRQPREENVELQLANLQKQLHKEIKKYREGQAPKEAVLDLVSQVEGYQRAQCATLGKEPVEGYKCVEYLVQVCLELAGIITDIVNKNNTLLGILKKQTACNVVTLIKVLFRDFVVFNAGYPREEMLHFIQSILLQEASEAEWIKLILEIVEDFLSQSQTAYSQKGVIDCLEKFNIPEGELLSYLAKKMKLSEERYVSMEKRRRSRSLDQLEREIFPQLASSLTLAIKSLRKLPIEDPDAIVHHGITCHYCGGKKPIVGMRYKCGHCANVNICSKSHCIKKHEDEFKDHILIAIPKPLPYGPSKAPEAPYKVLLPPMKLQHGSKVHEGIECDNCGVKNFEGIRYLCANCDYYNLCEKCYTQEKFTHPKTHVFLRLSEPLIQTETATPKALVPHLDPDLYPLQKTQKEEEESVQPLALKRSLSTLPERRMEYEKLDIDQTLQVAYRICIWICHSKVMDNKHKSVALKLCSELLCILLRLSTVESVSGIIQEDSQLDVVISAYLQIEDDKSVRKSLVKLISGLKDVSIKTRTFDEVKEMPREERREYLQNVEKTLQIRLHLSSCLHQILKALIDNAPKGKAAELVDIDSLTLLLDSYISILDSISNTKELLKKYKVVKDEELEIVLPEMARSLSLPATREAKPPKVRFTKPSLQLALGLISMLESLNPSTIGSMYGRMWEIVLKILSKINMKQVIEAKLFERLMGSFFLSTVHIQQTIYRQLLDISSKMIQFPNMSTLIINLIRSTLESAVNTSREEMAFYICRGWLDILLSGKSPKPITSKKEKKEKTKVTVFAKMEPTDVLDLLCFASNFLLTHLNFGSYKGVMGGKYKVMYRAILSSRMMTILANAKGKDENKLAVQELAESCRDTRLPNAFNNFLFWLFLNYNKNDTSCKLTQLVCKISKNVKSLFKTVSVNENLCKSLLGGLQEIVTVADNNISKRVESGELRIFLAVELNERVNKLLKKIMKYIMVSTTIATHFAFELKGFDFLFNRLGIAKEAPTEIEGQETSLVESDMMEGVNETIAVPAENNEKAETSEQKGKKEQFSPNLLMDEDFAKDMNLIECTGEANISSLHHINWCTYKGGQRSKIYTKQFKEGSKDEVAMTFELKKLVEVKEIQLSFINFWGMDNFEHLDVSSVVVEIGLNKGSYSYLCTLDKVNDKSLEVHGVTVFGRNMSAYDEALSKSDPVGQKLNSLKNARAKFIRLIIRTGVKVAFSGTQASKSTKQKALGVNYFSIIGYDPRGISHVQTYIDAKNQKVAYKLLNMFQMKTFRGCLKEFANTPAITNQLKVNFHTLASLMTPDKPTIEPFLIALCTHNADLGKWILQELIRSRESKGSALFMVQICLSNLEKVGESQELVLSFILKELEQLEQKRIEKPDAPKSLSQFVVHYVSLLHLVSPLLKAPITLNIGEEDLLLVLRQILQHWDILEVKEAFIKLFLVLLQPPSKIISKIDLLSFVSKHLFLPKDPRSLFLASFVSLFSNELGKKLLEMVPGELNLQVEQTAYDNLAILLNLSLDPELKRILAEKKLPLSVYEKLKNPQDKQTFMQPISGNLMSLAEELIKKSVIGFKDNEKSLAEDMIKDLTSIKDIEEKDAISKLILNLMRAENTVPVCLYNFDPECEQWKSLTAEDTLRKGKKRSFFLDTALLQQKQKDVLMGALRERVGIESEADKLFGSNWRLVFKEQGNPPQNSSERFKQFFEAVSGKGPFILFMAGMSEGKRAIVGGFTTTSFPAMPESLQNGQQLEIKSSPESLFFYYSENKMHHFEIRHKGENFGYIYVDYANCGACVLGNYFLSFSYSYSYSNSIGSLSSLKCIDGNISYLPYSFFVDTIEVWASEQDATGLSDSSDKDIVAPLTKILASEHSWYCAKSPYNAFRSNAVFNVPSHITIKELGECVAGKSEVKLKLRSTGDAIDEQEHIGKLYEEHKKSMVGDILDIEFEIGKDAKDLLSGTGYKPETPILAHFEKLDGYIALIDAAKASLAKWKNTKLSQKFQLYLEELMQFSKLADFFKSLLSNKKSKDFIFEIMAGTPDKDTSGKSKKETEAKERKWEEEYNTAVTYCYNIISQLFANPDNVEIREQAAKSDFMSLILTRLQKLSGEAPRKWHTEADQKPEITTGPAPSKIEAEKPSKKKVRKGVGYSTQVGEIWDVDKYMKSKKAKNSQITALINIVSNFIACDKWEPDDEFVKTLCESSLLPLLEASLASSSLLEMAKEFDLVTVYLDLLDKFREKDKLVPLLVELDPHYKPKQREPIYKALKNLNELSGIFLKCMEKEAELKAENEIPRKLAEQIQKCYKRVMRVVEKLQKERKGDEMKNILLLPLPQAYKALLRDLRFGYTNMCDEKGKYKHFYHAQAEQEKTASQNKLIRLAQELADLSNALPDEHTNAIYIRVDEQRIDFMKALVMGACNTPYGHGAFEYDIYCPANYPNESPKMNLTTTGNGAVRFNPNLYHDGKVCLSLLGTWRGTATENWDPKFSTILQVLMSLQAIVMSEEVYFNEPGFEGEIGKPEGERKNEGYANIVRYCNIKYAMIGQIKNPPKGFESVIKRHFYVKRPEILKEVHKWIEYADAHEASYDGLVYDHNSEWCNKFKQSKTRYKEMLTEIVKELEQLLNALEPPKELIEEAGGDISKIAMKEKEVLAFAGGESIEGIDVEEDTAEELAKKTAEKENKLNVDDVGVKDRWSRYIGAVGIDAVAKQAKSLVFLSGAGGLGIEIAKNIVLSGCKEFILHDTKVATKFDLSSQFFLTEADIGKNRATASVNRLQQLNYYVKVSSMTTPLPITESELDALGFNKYTVVILTECNYKLQLALDQYCRKHKIALIVTDVKGTMCKVINDFGSKFEVLDPDGEEPKECMIKEITNEEEGLVTTITGQRHGFADGDTILLKEVEGMNLVSEEKKEIPMGEAKTESINGTIHTVKFVDPFKFRIGDTRKYTKYIRNGIAKQVKPIRQIDFKELSEVYTGPNVLHDSNLTMLDFAKTDDIFVTHAVFQALDSFEAKNGKAPGEWDMKNADEVLEIVKEIYEKCGKTISAKEEDFIRKASYTSTATFSPLCAFIGGIVAQEVIKAITGKYTPINQVMYFNNQEVVPTIEAKDMENAKKILGIESADDRYIGVKCLLGEEVFKKMTNWKLFMVGVGAIGCELLKNYAMLGFGCDDGKILITDPDVIEVSNLNRQFLFKEKHLRKPKSTTAAAAVLQMNPTLKGKIIARTDKVHEGTAYIFTDQFFTELNAVTNALDNVQARRYIDSRCVTNKTPLLESGTLGAKGHVQVVVPYKTESYSSQNDPEETLDIPVCTLKMFPEEPVHCVEWARDKFEKIFTQKPKNLQKIADNIDFVPQTPQDIKTLKKALSWLKKKPTNFNDCLKYARHKFQKYFVNDIKQLMFVYPPDAKGKDGQLFWTLPKRPPHEIKFDPKNPLHTDYIMAVASLFARTWGMEVPANIRTEEFKYQYAKIAAEIPVPEYVPNAKKAKAISKEVEEDQKGKEPVVEEVEEAMSDEDENLPQEELVNKLLDELDAKMGEVAADNLCIVPEEFEKDNDLNFHIDFIYAMTNCRADCYGIDKISWITTKMKAGRIIPALASTTAVVAALQTVELVKLVKQLDVEKHRNAFVNLALPYMNLSEPGPAKVTQLTEELKVTIWDRWDVKLPSGFGTSFGELLDILKATYKLEPRDVFKGNKPIYMHAVMSAPAKANEKAKLMKSKIDDALDLMGSESYVDLLWRGFSVSILSKPKSRT
eukprot:TRINITY_DN395_c0_g1_i1.p1 TRINITY_DN395_c0_g1~~TRINITY_DN395_c0_g1_i1.p1  ORF type:complete len:5656 (-),score=802.26 TRINITY_DN395_c0_g1_i1:1614-18581(-)